MKNQSNSKKQQILRKQSILHAASKKLKQEFVGIDRVIDELIQAISAWYLFPDMQKRPLVVNLWGLTGVGKSSLVQRLSELLDYKRHFYAFDLGESARSDWSLKKQLTDLSEKQAGKPLMIALDEFQHARSINSQGLEADVVENRLLWQLLDTGTFYSFQHDTQVHEIFSLTNKLSNVLKHNVLVRNGKVIEGLDRFKECMKDSASFFLKEPEGDEFIPFGSYDEILDVAPERFTTEYELKEVLFKLDGKQSVAFLRELIEYAQEPKKVDCSNALIFVLGNLDEAYTMSGNFNPDMSPDEFHKDSLEISVPTIKKALKTRFRNEQIARLGNIHIIYPAFNESAFEQIIALELQKIAEKVDQAEGLRLHFHPSVHQLIYQEGVYPTQGCRPIFSTIHKLIQAHLGQIMATYYLEASDATHIELKIEHETLLVIYRKGEQPLHQLGIEQNLQLQNLRQDTRDDMQALTAVHEAGHAVLSMALLHTLPEMIRVKLADNDYGGFVHTQLNSKYIRRNEIIRRAAFLFGGMAAERLIFEADFQTSGSEADIEQATALVSSAIKEWGFGKNIAAAYQVPHIQTNKYAHDRDGAIANEMHQWLSEAYQLAESTLESERELLIQLANYLSDHSNMPKPLIRSYLEQFGKQVDLALIDADKDFSYYRKRLKEQVVASQFSRLTEAQRLIVPEIRHSA